MKKLINILALLMIAIGFFLLGQPYFELLQRNDHCTKEIERFRQQAASVQQLSTSSLPSSEPESAPAESSLPGSPSTSEPTYTELHKLMKAYNERIFQSRQNDLRDVFSYSSSVTDFDSAGLSDDLTAVLTIPAMQVELPVYIGSSTENMSRGATIMNQTSMPIGGVNTNCVIAAHRMGGYFGDIELLSIGDEVFLQNLWEKLTYRVAKIIVIDPYDIDKVKIQPGADMITLLTCHPYWSNATRYIVYCERVPKGERTPESSLTTETPSSRTDTVPGKAPEQTSVTEAFLPEGIAYEASQGTIQGEHIVRIGGMILSAILFVVLIVFLLKRRKHDSHPPKEETSFHA